MGGGASKSKTQKTGGVIEADSSAQKVPEEKLTLKTSLDSSPHASPASATRQQDGLAPGPGTR